MSFNESTVEAAALNWFRELGYAIGHGRHLAPVNRGQGGIRLAMRLLVGRLREDIRRLNPGIQFRTLSALRNTLLPKLLSGELSEAEAVEVAHA
jgi:hypothetical protein